MKEYVLTVETSDFNSLEIIEEKVRDCISYASVYIQANDDNHDSNKWQFFYLRFDLEDQDEIDKIISDIHSSLALTYELEEA